MSDYYFLKFTGTPSTSADFETAAADEDAISIELAVLAVDHDHVPEEEPTKYLGGTLSGSAMDRLVLKVEFIPFWNALPVSDSVPQNSDTRLAYRLVRKKKRLWISRPTTEGREAPPRYQSEADFPLTYALLPVCVECEPIESSIAKSDARTDVSQTFKAREVSP